MKRFLILAMACSICLTASGCFSQGSGASESAAVMTQPATGKATDDTAPSASVKPTESATEKATEKATSKPTEKPKKAEVVVDEMLAIRSEIDAWRERKASREANAAYNALLYYGLGTEDDDAEDNSTGF